MDRKRRNLALITAIAVGIMPAAIGMISCSDSPTAPAKKVEKSLKIAFLSDRDGNAEIYIMDADGSNQKNLTNNAASDEAFSWSPDGSRIAFASTRDGAHEIYSMNADGTNQTRLTQVMNLDAICPVWSPDGKKIAFASWGGDNYEILVMNDDGTNLTNLTHLPSHDINPTWSPDGSRIAFISADSTWNLWHELRIMNADGTDRHAVITYNHILRNPVWSPADTLIAFEMSSDPRYSNIWVNGTPGQLTPQGSGTNANHAWSPGGSRLAFTSTRAGNGEIYVTDVDGTNQARLTYSNWEPLGEATDFPSWTPDGSKIVFASSQTGNWEIYIMTADGATVTRLTNNAAMDALPQCSMSQY
jgi:Tol biopolymer transport system component